jgi:hypothetical protein
MIERDPLLELKAENARLIALLEANGIQWRTPLEHVPRVSMPVPSRLSTDEKVALFRRLFRGRTDVYPIRWGKARLRPNRVTRRPAPTNGAPVFARSRVSSAGTVAADY